MRDILAIRDKVAEGYTGRVMAGFCWPWTKEADADGELHKDVVVDDYTALECRREYQRYAPWYSQITTLGV
ncbi:hypothetical protein [Sphingobacterium chuzhouense]|uniref:Uncharacterized protein n=1 Tax=Sphingobacterium chuzhouense TaxID=1742264 RepID=A0ABR7XU83_9SPHI|nr:hypothetical protein [Sphingobacterium chuzhouense]MBD1422605.1 hypothetical protein [Sphingobacterium chuzhouense]